MIRRRLVRHLTILRRSPCDDHAQHTRIGHTTGYQLSAIGYQPEAEGGKRKKVDRVLG
jgi:hypothetical protein